MGDRAELHVNVRKATLIDFRRAVEDFHGTRYGHVQYEVEAALKRHANVLRKAVAEEASK